MRQRHEAGVGGWWGGVGWGVIREGEGVQSTTVCIIRTLNTTRLGA